MAPYSFERLLKSSGFDFGGDDVVNAMSGRDGPLAKSFTLQHGASGITPGALMLENLDSLMTDVLLSEKHIKLFNFFTKVPSAQQYFEWNRRTSFGNSRGGGLGFAQGGGPKGAASTFVRSGEYVKFLGVKGGITHQMLTAGQMGGVQIDPTTEENRDRSLQLLTRLDREMIHGNKAIKSDAGVEVNFDGLLTKLAADNAANVIDMEGAAFGFDQLDASALDLVTTGKLPTVDSVTTFMTPEVNQDLVAQYAARGFVRHLKNEQQQAVFTPGFVLPGYQTAFGTIKFDYSLLMHEVENSAPPAAADTDAPAATAAVTGVVASEVTSKMVAGSYYYSAGAFNDAGESLITTSTVQAVSAGEKVTLTITRVTGATGYRVYRGLQSDGSDAQWIGRVAQPTSGNATFVDLNGWRTKTAAGAIENGLALVVEPDPKDVVVAQLSPLMRMMLPQVDTTFPFFLLLYVTLVLKAPERVRIYKNCGRYTPQ